MRVQKLRERPCRPSGVSVFQTAKYTQRNPAGNAEAIGKGMSEGCAVQKITLPKALVTIEENAFAQTGLREIAVPKTVTSLGAGAFQECKALQSAALPGTLTSIEKNAFKGCLALENIDLPKALVTIGDDAFSQTGLRQIEIPKTVTSLGAAVFQGCDSLQSAALPETLTVLESNVFEGCLALEKIALPKTLVAIKEKAFAVTGLRGIDVPESVTSLGASVFADCGSLAAVRFCGAALESIGEKAFWFCASLKALDLPEGLASIGAEAFSFCQALQEAVVPQSVVSLGQAFCCCKNLRSLVLPDARKRSQGLCEDCGA